MISEEHLLDLLHMCSHVLLVQPAFHSAQKSRNHQSIIPLSLLKFAGYCDEKEIKYALCTDENVEVYDDVDLIFVSTRFTYEADVVRDCIKSLREVYPLATIVGGGIYASLLPDHFLSYCGADYVYCGTVEKIDKVKPRYDLISTDTQILQTSRGCIRKCGFCGTYKIEPQFNYKKSIWHEVCKKRVIFYDNNLLANPYIENILDEMIRLRRHKKISYIEAQSGIDARLLTKTIAMKLYKAGFKNITFAWDGKYEDKKTIDNAIELLTDAGYDTKSIRAFILYNYDISYLECERKRVHLFKMGLQVMPCRYIPLTSTGDGYNPYLKSQNSDEYYIHTGWTDAEVRMFKRNCRQHNICIRFSWNFYSSKAEHKTISLDEVERLQGLSSVEARRCGCFDPAVVRFV